MTKARDLGNLVSLNSFFADGTIQASEITGLAASATIDTTNASNITSGTIAAARLPSYVDDVLEFANFAALPATGETGKIYVALDTNKTFRWSGSAYIEISPAPAGGSNTQVQYNNNGLFAGSANMTFNGTRLSVADFADASLTSGRVTYATTGGNLTDSANLLFDGTTFTYQSAISLINNDGSGNKALVTPFAYGGSGATGTLVLSSTYGNSNQQRIRVGVGGAAAISFDIDSVEGARLTSTGLGIGTSSPATILHTYGTAPTFERTTTATTAVRNTLNLRAITTGSAADGFGPFIEFTLTDAETTAGTLGGIAAVRAGADNTGNLLFFTATTGSNAEQMRLTSTGLGIGTSSPSYRLDVSSASTPVARFTGATNAYVDFSDGTVTSRLQNSGALLFGTTSNHSLLLRTNSTTQATLDTSGNWGLGVTPSAWSSSFKALQVSNTIIANNGAADSFFGSNYFFDGTNNKYITSAHAAAYGQVDGAHLWYTAPSGTAGTNVTAFSNATMTLDASGRLLVGVTTAATGIGLLQIGQSATNTAVASIGTSDVNRTALLLTNFTGATGNNKVVVGFDNSGRGGFEVGMPAATNAFYIYDTLAATERVRIDNSGNVGIGRTPSARLDVEGAGIVRGFLTTTDAIKLGGNTSAPASTDAFIYRPTDNTLGFGTASAEKMRLDVSGNLGIGVTPSAWSGNYKAIEFPGFSIANFNGGTNQQAQYLLNAYDSAAGTWRYKITGAAPAMYRQSAGIHEFHTASAGTAGNIITWTQSMTLDASGRLGVGTTSPQQPFVVSNGGALGFEFVPASGIMQTYNRSTSAYNTMRFDASDILFFTGSPSERMRITSTGRVGINTQAPASTLGVDGRISLGNSSNYWPLAQLGTPTFHISPSGNDTTGDGSYANPWATLGKALAEIPKFLPHSVVGATIVLKNGTYTVAGDVYIRGFNGHGTIQINAETSGSVTVNFSNWGQFYFDRNAATFEFNGITFNTLTTPRAFYINSTRMVTFNNNCAINQQTQSGTNEAFNWIIDVNDSGLNLNCPLTVINPSSYGAVINVNGFSSAYFGPNGTISKSGTKHPNAAVCINQVSHGYFQNTINNFTIGINMGQSHYDAEYAGFAIANNLSLTNCTIGIRLSNNGNFKNYYTTSTSGTTTPVYWANGWYSGQYGSEYAYIGYNTSVSSSYRLQVNSQIYATSSTIATSDGRFKENVQTLSDGLDLVMKLRPVQFDWKEHPVHNFDLENTTVGFIAQEVQTALADTQYVNSIVKSNHLVIEAEQYESTIIQPAEPAVYNEYGVMIKPETPPVTEKVVIKPAVTEEFLGIAEGNLVALLTKAIQELKQQNDTLAQKVAELESKIG